MKEYTKDMIDMRQTMKYISHNGACDLLVVVDSMSVIKYLIQTHGWYWWWKFLSYSKDSIMLVRKIFISLMKHNRLGITLLSFIWIVYKVLFYHVFMK